MPDTSTKTSIQKSEPAKHLGHTNPTLPKEARKFTERPIGSSPVQLTEEQWLGALHATEVEDMKQQIKFRPWFIYVIFTLVILQSIGIGYIVLRALDLNQLPELQLILSTLVAGTLTQSYLLLRFITNKIFGDIDYHNENRRR